MKNRAVVTIPSHPKFLSVIRAVTATMGKIHGMDEMTIEDLKLAVDEACSNVIKHAYRGDTSQGIVVKFNLRKGFEVIIEDTGIKADPTLVEGRNLDDVRPGGLGIHFIKRVFDIFEFDRKKKRGNRLRLLRQGRNRGEDPDRRP
jgi:anti-sigma regulatory factor (Ser/Thr protein kinase)